MSVELNFENINEFEIDNFLKQAVANKVSDIHLRINTPPVVRKDGIMIKTAYPMISEQDMDAIVQKIIPERHRSKITDTFDFDFSLELPNIARFRVNMCHELGKLALILRLIPLETPTLRQLSLPPTLSDFANLNNGIVLVTGPTGSGKSTTLASLLDYINQGQQKHIVTLEDPIEFVHKNKNCIFTQRQLGTDTDTFPNGVKYSLRQDPDIILIW